MTFAVALKTSISKSHKDLMNGVMEWYQFPVILEQPECISKHLITVELDLMCHMT